MLVYVKHCKEKYTKGNEDAYIRCLLSGIKRNEGEEKVVRRATKAILDLSRQQGRDAFISITDILSRAGFERYRGSGLWPWLKKNADVIEKYEGCRAYRIKKEFYSIIDQMYTEIGQDL
ncbi:MAG TPA: hypothetical protein DCR59_04590 [Dehalococcoidia bacterium]|nr:hypothetical protein [Dehalococcoidia bacterium]